MRNLIILNMDEATRLIMYLRKSSEREDRQALSTPAQKRELESLAVRRNLTIVGEPVEEAMSAKRPGRPGFADVLEAIRRHQADGILVWALDRLARNPIDGASLMWALGEKQIKAIVTPDRTYTGSGDDKLLMSIMFGMATKFSDDLSKNIRRGNQEAVLGGNWPSCPKLGYVRATDGSGRLVRDPARFDVLQNAWSMRMAGQSMGEILEYLNSCGFRTPVFKCKGGKPLAVQRLYRMLSDPFYAGIIVYGGQRYAGAHEPMVDLATFDRVTGRNEKAVGRPMDDGPLDFPFRGFVRCGTCGRRVVPERHTNRYGKKYVYYRCVRKSRIRRNGFCPEPSIREDEITRRLHGFAEEIWLPDDVLQLISEEIDHLDGTSLAGQRAAVEQLRRDIERVERRLKNLRTMFADRQITEAEFVGDRSALVEEQIRLNQALAKQTGTVGIEPLKDEIIRVNDAAFSFGEAEPNKKAAFVRLAVSNLSLSAKSLLIEAKEPHRSLAKLVAIPDLWSRREQTRIILQEYCETIRKKSLPTPRT